MPHSVLIRPIRQQDLAAWEPLWDGYNAFYGRSEATALPPKVTEATWHRFFVSAEPVFALVAEINGKLVGFTHYLFHRSTTRIELVCYLEDLFTSPAERGRGIGRALIEGVYQQATRAGLSSGASRMTSRMARRTPAAADAVQNARAMAGRIQSSMRA